MMGLFDAAVHRFRDTPALKVMLDPCERPVLLRRRRSACRRRRRTARSRLPRRSAKRHRLKLHGMHRIYDEMEAIEKPIVVRPPRALAWAADSNCRLSCDFRLAAKSARYSFPEGKFGVLPRLERRQPSRRGFVGTHWARYLIMANLPVDADRALIMGLVHDVYPDETFRKTCCVSAVTSRSRTASRWARPRSPSRWRATSVWRRPAMSSAWPTAP